MGFDRIQWDLDRAKLVNIYIILITVRAVWWISIFTDVCKQTYNIL